MTALRRQAGNGAPVVTVGEGKLGLAQITAVAYGNARVAISNQRAFIDLLDRSRSALARAMEAGVPVYGATTGFGAACGWQVPPAKVESLGENLIRYHGCGVGEPLEVPAVRAAILCRMLSLAQGYSAVGQELIEALGDLLNHDVTPVIPAQGSVGASGDLTPLSYLAACLQGEREAFHKGVRQPAQQALEAAGLKRYRFKAKEPLALINGTAVMTGLAVLAVERSRKLLQASQWATALTVHALAGHAHHFHPALFSAKPHPGQARVAQGLRDLLRAEGTVPEADEPTALQDPYSCRCSPHVLGVLADALDWITAWVEVEANSVSDNPLLDPETGTVLMGGNFYGGHVAFAMDSVKAALASVADLCDRQVALLVDQRFSRGLPANLVRAEEPGLHHGFKGMQITASALTAELQQKAMPAAVFSRSTESHNQDKVSLGTTAARDALESCWLCARVLAVHLLAAAQAAEIRGSLPHRPGLCRIVEGIRALSKAVVEDRPMDHDIERLAEALLRGELPGGQDA